MNLQAVSLFSYTVLALIGLIGQVAVFITLRTGWIGQFRSMPFYYLIVGLAIGDTCYLLSVLVSAGPELIVYLLSNYDLTASHADLATAIQPGSWVRYVIGVLNSIGSYALFMFTGLISANRFTVFLLPKCTDYMFGPKSVKVTTKLVLAISFIGGAAIWPAGCPKVYHHDPYYWFFDESFGKRFWNITGICDVWMTGQSYSERFWPYIFLLLYISVFINLRCFTERAIANIEQRKKTEISLLTQGCVITLLLVVHTTTFWFTSDLQYYFGFSGVMLIQWVALMNSVVNPVIYFLRNELMQNQFKKSFGIMQSNVHPSGTPPRPVEVQ